MSTEEWAAEREKLLAWIDALLATGTGIFLLVIAIGLFIGAIVLSGFLLVELGRGARRVSIPAPSWQGVDVLAALFAWFLVQVFAELLAMGIAPAFPGLGTELAILLRGLASLAFAGALLALPLLRAQPLVALGIGSDSFARGLRQGVVVWAAALPGLFAVLIGVQLALLLLGVEPDGQDVVKRFQEGLERGDLALVIAILTFGIVVAPILEELLFRAILHRWLAARLGVAAGAALSGLFFGLVHGSLSALVPIALLGVLLALLLERTGNLWSCIALHAVFNAGQLGLMLVLARTAG
jgi:membrane protease YdiL (CAAX protease family)